MRDRLSWSSDMCRVIRNDVALHISPGAKILSAGTDDQMSLDRIPSCQRTAKYLSARQRIAPEVGKVPSIVELHADGKVVVKNRLILGSGGGQLLDLPAPGELWRRSESERQRRLTKFAGLGYSVRGGNITPDRESGIGDWSDDELRAAITHGLGRSGKLAPLMPSESYAILTDRDANAIVAYLRSASPVAGNKAQQQQRLDVIRRPSLPGAESSLSEEALRDIATRGLYVVSVARCMACHSGETNDIPDHVNGLGAGDKIFRTPAGVAVASNITSDPENGIGSWTDEELKRAITQGVSRDGHTLKPTMANLSRMHFSKMTADHIEALVRWLRTIPARK